MKLFILFLLIVAAKVVVTFAQKTDAKDNGENVNILQFSFGGCLREQWPESIHINNISPVKVNNANSMLAETSAKHIFMPKVLLSLEIIADKLNEII